MEASTRELWVGIAGAAARAAELRAAPRADGWEPA
jgi:hypothetical protein